MQDQLTDHLDQQLKSTSLENFSDYLKNLQQLPSLQDFFSVYIAKHALRIAQLGELYAKVPRDAAIMMHINNEKWNLIDINIFLEEHGLDVISLSKKNS